jgi:hypothetical protein
MPDLAGLLDMGTEPIRRTTIVFQVGASVYPWRQPCED